MPTFNDPIADAAEAQQALRGLAHATRSIDDPRQLYPVLRSLSAATLSLSQSLHQLAAFHDVPAQKRARVTGDDRAERAAPHQVSWELHRTGEILRQVAASLDRAHEVEASIAYNTNADPLMRQPPRPTPNQGLSL